MCHTGLVWSRRVEGRTLHFHLAGIKNQNFIMRDEETGSWWQSAGARAAMGTDDTGPSLVEPGDPLGETVSRPRDRTGDLLEEREFWRVEAGDSTWARSTRPARRLSGAASAPTY